MSISFVFVGARIYYLSQVDHGIADAEPASGAGKSSIPIAITFATILKQCRTELGLTQAQLAARAAISLSLLRKYESGARLPPLAMAVRLADALGLRGEERGALLDAVRFQRLPATNAGNGASAGGVLHTRLPVAPTPLLGREAALSELTRLIRSGSTRLITLVGPPGVGKSRLALAATWAAQSTFVDGAYFVELAELDDPSAVAAKIALRLGITGEDVEAAILSFLSQRSLLLCLDNFEHLTTAAPLLARILAVAPGIIILVTSRVPLRLRAETRVRVKPLALPTKRHLSAVVSAPAIRLFCERARAVEPSFTLNAANVEAVTSLCHFLDGVPLAIELAAARIDTLEPAAILAGLRDNLDDLDSGFADLPAHQRSLNATIAWSERMLSPVAQLSFARLGVFRGAFDATAADALGVAELDQLVEAGLVQSGERGQFRLLETIRVYADTRLQNLPDSAVTYLRHAAHYAAFAEAAGPMLEGASAASILGQIDDNLPNLRAAIRWSLSADGGVIAAQITTALRVYWLSRRAVYEARLIEPLLMSADLPAIPPVLLGRALITVGYVASQQGSLQSTAQIERGIALARQAGSLADVAQGLAYLGMLNRYPGNFERCEAILTETITLARQHQAPTILAYALNQLGMAYRMHGQFSEALPRLTEAVDLMRDTGDHIMFYRYQCDLADALRGRGDLLAARRLLNALERELTDNGDAMALWETHLRLAIIDVIEGALDRADRHLNVAARIIGEMGIRYAQVVLWRWQGYLALAANRHDVARMHMNAARQEAFEVYYPEELAAVLIGLAYLDLRVDQMRAARLFGAAEGLIMRYRLWPDQQAEQLRQAVRSALPITARELADVASQIVIDRLPRLTFDSVVLARDTARLDRVIAAALRG